MSEPTEETTASYEGDTSRWRFSAPPAAGVGDAARVGEEAVSAAAVAMEDAALTYLGRDLGTLHRDDIARAALTAALPHLAATSTLAKVREDDAAIVKMQREKYLDSPTLDPAWVAGWHAATDHIARAILDAGTDGGDRR